MSRSVDPIRPAPVKPRSTGVGPETAAPTGEELRSRGQAFSVERLADELLDIATGDSNGRAARTIHGGSDSRLRHVLIALATGCELDTHSDPGEATLVVLRGALTVDYGQTISFAAAGDFLALRRAASRLVRATENTVMLLTVVPRGA